MNYKTDPRLNSLNEELDRKYAQFMDTNKNMILQQASATSTERELPYVPIFESFLQNGFKSYISSELKKQGYNPLVCNQIIAQYKNRFFYTTLPSLSYNNFFEQRKKPIIPVEQLV